MIRSPAERGLLKAIEKEQLEDRERLMERYPGGTWDGRVYVYRGGQVPMRAVPAAIFEKISNASGLSEGRTYQILRELRKRGLISIEEGYDHSGTAPQRCWEYRLTNGGRRALEEENEC